ncbi:hypothetical protein GIB67_011473 [Kingdonia uniflora]|uniref:Uncharacterized protein n=1 Tax=Kingdonia uniflora TaxID=39325 RepID=A0A7J7NMB9_9MAGN|nr:hypothetical protein GIB67_011473 [Kingdonia uniflora]
MRIKIGVDASNASLTIKLTKQRKECNLLQDINAKLAEQSERQHPEPVHNVLVAFEELVVIPKEEAVPSPDLQKKIDELTVKYEEAVKKRERIVCKLVWMEVETFVDCRILESIYAFVL